METAEFSGVLLKLEPEKVQCVKFGKVKRIVLAQFICGSDVLKYQITHIPTSVLRFTESYGFIFVIFFKQEDFIYFIYFIYVLI